MDRCLKLILRILTARGLAEKGEQKKGNEIQLVTLIIL